MSRVGVRMRMVRVHVEDHAAWSGDQMGWEMDGTSENHVGLVDRWDFRWDRGLDTRQRGQVDSRSKPCWCG